MVKSDLIRDMKQACNGSSLISCKELTDYLGQKNQSRIKDRYLKELTPVAAKRYFIPEVAEKIMEGMG